MTQQINLLNPALLKKRDLFTPANILAVYGFLFVGILTLGAYEYNACHAAELEAKASSTALAEVQQLLTRMRASAANNAKKQQLLTRIESLEQKQAMQEAVLDAAKHDESHQGESYASLLKAFAKQSMSGLWITALNIDQDAQHLSISGRTLNPDLVPAYINKLRKEPALKGKSFTDLTMQYHETKPVLAQETNNQRKVNTEKSQTSIEADKASLQPLAYIEFTLQSAPETTEQKTTASVSNGQKVEGAH